MYKVIFERLQVYTSRAMTTEEAEALEIKRKLYAARSMNTGYLTLDAPLPRGTDLPLLPSTNDETIGGGTLKYGFVLRLVNLAGSSCAVCKHWLKARVKNSDEHGSITFNGKCTYVYIYYMCMYVLVYLCVNRVHICDHSFMYIYILRSRLIYCSSMLPGMHLTTGCYSCIPCLRFLGKKPPSTNHRAQWWWYYCDWLVVCRCSGGMNV